MNENTYMLLALCGVTFLWNMVLAASAGILYPTVAYPTDALLQSFLPTDASILFVGLPILLGSMWLTRRGRLLGLLFWPGALFFALYNYLVYILTMPLNAAFLLHFAIVTLSVYTLSALPACSDYLAVQRALAGGVSERLAGGVLAGLGLLFFLRVMGIIAGALIDRVAIPEIEFALNRTDYLTAPASVIGGVLLWQRKAFGFVVGLGLLFQASMLFVGLIIFLLLQPILVDAPSALVDLVIVFAMGLLCFIPFALVVRGVMSVSNASGRRMPM